MAESLWTRHEIVSALLKSPHGDLATYVEPVTTALHSDAEFVAHLTAWQWDHGSIRDAKLALPVVTLKVIPPSTDTAHGIIRENALAHLAMLNPRELVRAREFAKTLGTGSKSLKGLIAEYIHARERSPKWFDRTALQFRKAFTTLYVLGHVKPSPRARKILWDKQYPEGSVFAALRDVSHGEEGRTAEALDALLTQHKPPFLTVQGVLGARLRDPKLLCVVLDTMTAAEVITNAALLKKCGVMDLPETRVLFEQKLAQPPKRGRQTPLLKTTKAADALEQAGATALATKMRGAQERQLDAAQGIEGNVLVIGDKSGSMDHAIEYTRHLCAAITRMVRGRVYGLFVDTAPRVFDATGKSYDQLLKETRLVQAGGGTSLGCGLDYAMRQQWDVDCIVLVTDGGENQAPLFADTYTKYVATVLTREVPVSCFLVTSQAAPQFLGSTTQHRAILAMLKAEQVAFRTRCTDAGVPLQVFDVTGTDYYAIPTLLQTIRGSRYGLIDEIYATPLKTRADVLGSAAIRRMLTTV